MFDRLVAALTDFHCLLCQVLSRKPVCGQCSTSAGRFERTPGGLLVCSLGSYGSPIGERIVRLKYQEETLLAHRLGTAMAQIFPSEWLAATLIPVPLHPERLAERGYNQSALLARKVGALKRLPIEFERLKRRRATQAQAQLSYRERVANAEDAFSCTSGRVPAAYVLVDDVVTTGKTAEACATSLKRTGARVLGVLTVATGGGLTHL